MIAHSITQKRLANQRLKLSESLINYCEENSEEGVSFNFPGEYSFSILVSHSFPFDIPHVKLHLQPDQFSSLKTQAPITEFISGWNLDVRLQSAAQTIPNLLSKSIIKRNRLPSSKLIDFLYLNNLATLFLLAFSLRILVGLGPYSGYNHPPLYGDYQAQRNWMQLTVSRPIELWYHQTQQKPWWRLDYPPMSGYHSYVLGLISSWVVTGSVEAGSRGFESASHKLFMRMSVIGSEVFFFLAVAIFYYTNKKINLVANVSAFFLLVSPPVLLIDHGHFQYNSVMAGMLLLTLLLITHRQLKLAAVLFVLTINFKQTALFYSLAIFAYYIGFILQKSRIISSKQVICYPTTTKIFSFFYYFCFFGVIVLSTFALLWAPWIFSQKVYQVLSAIFPVHRGLYQLKVANFWCTFDPLLKFSQRFSQDTLVKLSAFFTLLFSLPSCYPLLILQKKRLLYMALFNVSLTAFFFGYHMHEKTLLIPLFVMLPGLKYYGEKVLDYQVYGCVAMFHLMKEDGQALQYVGVLPAFYILGKRAIRFLREGKIIERRQKGESKISKVLDLMDLYQDSFKTLLHLLILLLHLADLLLQPPLSLPFLFNLLFSALSFVGLLWIWVWSNLRLWESFHQKIDRIYNYNQSKMN